MIEVLKSGLLTTIQDIGRLGYQQYGMTVGGAVDTYASRVANALVGNALNEASLEITLVGPVLKAREDMFISITGANLAPHKKGKRVPMWTSFVWEKGSVIDFREASCGLRSYLAVAGGFDVPIVMGSRSTYIPAGIGGFKGRALHRGDILKIRSRRGGVQRLGLASRHIPSYPKQKTIRVVLGPDDRLFSRKGVDTFLISLYTVSNELNRMGMRLIGDKIEHNGCADIPSRAVTFGTIQVATDGQPIAMLADHQTTGGYTQIATVITVDHSLLAQSQSGDVIRFQKVSLDEARMLLKKQNSFLKQLERV